MCEECRGIGDGYMRQVFIVGDCVEVVFDCMLILFDSGLIAL